MINKHKQKLIKLIIHVFLVRTINTLMIVMMPSILLLAMVATVQCEDEKLSNEVVKIH